MNACAQEYLNSLSAPSLPINKSADDLRAVSWPSGINCLLAAAQMMYFKGTGHVALYCKAIGVTVFAYGLTLAVQGSYPLTALAVG